MIAPSFEIPTELSDAPFDSVSAQALALFNLLVKLSRRTGAACVNFLCRLAEMFRRSERATRYALAELLEAGWIGRKQTRRGGKSQLFFWPLVRPVAACFAGSSEGPLQVAQVAPLKKTERDNNAANVVASSSEEIPAQILALGVGRMLSQKLLAQHPIERVKQAAQAVAAYLSKKPGNAEALLTVAAREGWVPPAQRAPAAAASHILDVRQNAKLMGLVEAHRRKLAGQAGGAL